MVNKQTKDGVHTDTREGAQYSHDEFKLMQTQDLGYLNLRMVQESSKIEKLKGQLHIMNSKGDNVRVPHFYFNSRGRGQPGVGTFISTAIRGGARALPRTHRQPHL